MGKKRVPVATARAISRRLNEFVHREYRNWPEFERATGIPPSTRRQWSVKSNPSVPDYPHLITISQRSGLSLDWLLTGRGNQLAEQVVATPEGRVVAAIEAELRATEDASQEEFDAAWVMLHSLPKTKRNSAVFQLAVDAVRGVYSEILWHVRGNNLLQQQAAAMVRQVLTDQLVSPEVLQDLLTHFAQQLAAYTVPLRAVRSAEPTSGS